jgi:hypothetical protein
MLVRQGRIAAAVSHACKYHLLSLALLVMLCVMLCLLCIPRILRANIGLQLKLKHLKLTAYDRTRQLVHQYCSAAPALHMSAVMGDCTTTATV